ncbi:gliding motility-associated C-terminal domain-containing protein [Pustulibacterium marinum]|uniref:Gliding motility-associated C-terminal domain-containing protein n=1 Tax=Pustulibacterium marinum TaxID=1224947 RepID=A0A1I7ITC8_9FLAO|nr:choice-of-anchor L domain-containing protein [Pustulibacterium marinum]SFU76195.1 gliding motility-associated C-terminal domain-containing protein [Pustulibacterium marinum]
MGQTKAKLVKLLVLMIVFVKVSFAQTTTCAPLTTPFTETFNSNSTTEDCWTVINQDGDNLTWDLNYNFAYFVYEGDQAASITKYWNSTTNDDYLISPTIQLTGTQRLKFHYRVVSASSPTDLEVLVSTTGTDIANFTDVIMPQETISNGTYEERILYLDDYTGDVNIAFHTPQIDANNWTLYLDEVIVEDIPECATPTDLTVLETTNTSATLAWEQGYQETQWEVFVQPVNSGIPTGNGTLANDNTFVAENLEASTFYEYYVRAYCSDTAQSEWVGAYTFNTAVCAAENQCNYTVTLEASYVGGNFSQLTIQQGTITVGTLVSTSSTDVISVPLCSNEDFQLSWNTTYWDDYTTSVTITDAYDEIVFQWNNGDSISTPFYQGTASCEQEACPLPTEVSLVSQDQNSITIDWEEQGSATSWEVYVVPFGSEAPDADSGLIGETATEHPYQINDLISGQEYDIYVRSLCGDEDGNSSWTQVEQFGTLIENDDCANAITLTVSDSPFCSDSYAATLNMATASNQGDLCGDVTFANDDVWFEFTATSTSHILYIKNILENGTPEGQNTSHNLNKVIYTGTCDNLTQVACVEDDNSDEFNYYGGFYTAPNTNDDDILLDDLTIGETYTIRVYSNYEEQKNYTFDICVATPENAMSIDQDTYTSEGLVGSVLMNDDCISISNFSTTTGIDFGAEHNGIAYFEAADSSFPFANGILLTTGNATQATGPKLSMQTASFYDQTGTDLWLGDADLQSYLSEIYPDDAAITLYDATILEFDFIAYGDHMNFNFLFASEDYGVPQCQYGDGFAFLLTDDQGVTTNLAVIPGTDTPVSVRTIKDNAYNAGCPSENEAYFDNLFDGMLGASRYASANNFYGMTVPMVAEADLVFGHQYHLKLVIADEGDGNWDSGVFIEGGSFQMTNNLSIGEDILLGDEEAVCEGQPVYIDLGNLAEGTQITWYKDGEVIEGATDTILETTSTGDYSVEIVFPNTDCINSDTKRIEFYPQPYISFPQTEMYVCVNEGIDLTVTLENESDFDNNIVYTWYNEEGTEVQSSYSDTYHIAPNSGENGLFTVVVTDELYGCEASATVDVLYSTNANCIVPQGISPNDDAYNNCLNLDFFSNQGNTINIQIFNRYGKEVYQRNNYVNEWCGTDQDGNQLPVGTYFYVITFPNGSQKTMSGYIYINY